MQISKSGLLQSHTFRVCFCGMCPNTHLVFFDNEGIPFAEATMSLAQAEDIVRKIRENNIDPRPVGAFEEEPADAPRH